jgi:hypothetical protein
VDPSEFEEVIESMPAMEVNWRSSGVATAEAIVAGLAPGREAEMVSVGKSTFGKSLTGSARYDIRPNTAMPSISRLVAIGLSIKMREKFMKAASQCCLPAAPRRPPPGAPGR